MRFVAVDRDWPAKPAFQSISAEAERLFWRIMVSSDAHGTHRAEPVHLLSMLDLEVQPKSVLKWLDELMSAGLVVVWKTDGKAWLEIIDYDAHQTPSMIEGRWPRSTPPAPALEAGASMAIEAIAGGKATQKDDRVDEIRDVFLHWEAKERATGGIKGAKLTSGRRSRIVARLSEGYTVEQLKQCVDGYLADPFYLGTKAGSRGTRYTGLDTIFLNGERVERGIAMGATVAAKSETSERFAAYDKVGV